MNPAIEIIEELLSEEQKEFARLQIEETKKHVTKFLTEDIKPEDNFLNGIHLFFNTDLVTKMQVRYICHLLTETGWANTPTYSEKEKRWVITVYF